jgi:hypothetical protein
MTAFGAELGVPQARRRGECCPFEDDAASDIGPTCDPRQSRLRLTRQPTALRLGQGGELAFAVGRNGSRRIAHRLRPDLGMLVVADYQVRQALGWEGRAALMSRAITMGGYS